MTTVSLEYLLLRNVPYVISTWARIERSTPLFRDLTAAMK